MATSTTFASPLPTNKPAKRNDRVDTILSHPTLSLLERSRNANELTQIHSRLIKVGLIHHPLFLTRLMAAVSLSPSSDMNYAQSIFDRDKNPNPFSYNVMIRGYSQNDRPENVLSMFYKMLRDDTVLPNQLTFPFVFRACSKLNAVKEGMQAHGQVFKHGLDLDVFVQNALILMYASCGFVFYARQVFEKMDRPDVVSWNSIITGLADSGFVGEAHEFFYRMPERNAISWNCLINAYVKAGSLGIARSLFDEMPVKDSITWNTMIGGYVGLGLMEDACGLFDRMPSEMKDLITFNMIIDGCVKGCKFEEVLKLFEEIQAMKIKPNNFTIVSVLSACSHLGALEQGEWIHVYIGNNGIRLDAVLWTALIDMYAKCGKIERALAVFRGMEERDVGAWNSIISNLGIHGYGKEALTLFSEMLESEISLDEITFVSVLSACRHSGLVDEGWKCFQLMLEVYNMVPKVEHYGCMVDLLGRVGLMNEAKELIETMDVDSSVPMWGSLLGACSRLGNLKMGEYAAKRLLELDPRDSSCYVVLSNMYAAAGRWDDAIEVRKQMRDDGIEKLPGCSSIEVNGIVQEFRVGNGLDPLNEMV